MIIKTQEQIISQVVYSVTIFTAGITGRKNSSGPANRIVLQNLPCYSSSSLPAASFPIFSLLLLYNLGIGVEGALVSFRRLETTHELMLVCLEKNMNLCNIFNFYTSICKKITCFTAAILFTPGFAIPSPFFLSYLEIALQHSPYG